jgi:hypothetical protein
VNYCLERPKKKDWPVQESRRWRRHLQSYELSDVCAV